MALCPFAKHELIEPGANDPRIEARVVIWHVAVSMAVSLFRFFSGPSGGIESHFYINWRGKIIQYRDTGWEADANWHANPFAISVETAGWAGGRWNRAQRNAMQRLALWLNEAEGIPLRKCDSPTGSGHGYHVQFGAPGPWTPVAKSCPGPKRIDQFEDWFVPWMNSNPTSEEDDMTPDEMLAALESDRGQEIIRKAVADTPVTKPPNDPIGRDSDPTAKLDNVLTRVWRKVCDIERAVLGEDAEGN